MLFCGIIAYFYSESVWPFVISGSISLSIGLFLYFVARRQNIYDIVNRREAYITVVLSWLVICLVGSLPYIISNSIPSYVDAIFESVSGFTTTGSSILMEIEILPKSILFWRSLTHWIGGLGIIVLVIIIMPSLNMGSYYLFSLESSLQERIHPQLQSVGYRLLLIYLLLTITEVLLLLLGNMNLFESVCHAFGTIATGGFSPKNTSISEYSPYVQYVVMIFMFLSGTSFVVHYHLMKRNFKRVRENEEFWFYSIMVILIGAVVTGSLFFTMHKSLEVSFREGFFQVISIVTCTGYATEDYLLWPEFAWMIIFFAMLLGGSTGSTAGGIKMVRHLVVMKNIINTFRQLAAPKAVLSLRLNNKPLPEEANSSILAFILTYILVLLAGSLLLIMLGIDYKTASSSVATCMAGIGPGIGTVGPANNFAHLPDTAKFILSFLMIAGRLEIYTILILFSVDFWKM